MCSPLVCQSIAAAGTPWGNFYFGSLVLSFLNVVFVAYSFRPTLGEQEKEMDEYLSKQICDSGRGLATPRTLLDKNFEDSFGTASEETVTTKKTEKGKSMVRMVVALPYQWAFSLLMFLYCSRYTALSLYVLRL
jgi:hypothetical protein